MDNDCTDSGLAILKRISGSGLDSQTYYDMCRNYISAVIRHGVSSSDRNIREFCVMATVMGIRYVSGARAPMYVSVREGEDPVFCIDPVLCVSTCDLSSDVIFILAHEMLHLVRRHLILYRDLMSDSVSAIFVNIATDIEINTDLCAEYRFRRPLNAITGVWFWREWADSYKCRDFFDMINNTQEEWDAVFDHENSEFLEKYIGSFLSKGSSVRAENMYRVVDSLVRDLFGYSISGIVYRFSLLGRGSFIDDVYKVLEGKKPAVIRLQDGLEDLGKGLCAWIAKYIGGSPTCYMNRADRKDSGTDMDISERCSTSVDCSVGNVLPEYVDVYLREVFDSMKTLTHLDGSSLVSSFLSCVELDGSKEDSVIRWQSVLRNRLMCSSVRMEKSRKRINRRQPRRLELSGRKVVPDVNITVAIDESGSISNEEYRHFIAELIGLVETFNCNVNLMLFTSCVESFERVPRNKLRSLKDGSLYSSRLVGGTNFQCIFDALYENHIPREDLVIVFTDGNGESSVDFRGYENRLWVSTLSGVTCEGSSRNVFPINEYLKLGSRK